MPYENSNFANAAGRHIIKSIRILALATAGFSMAHAGTSAVTLAWDANPETDIAGYQLSYGTSSGAYSNVINVGTNTTASVPGLTEGTAYYFVVFATNQAGLQSPPSSEVSYVVPAAPVNNAPVATSSSVTTEQGTPVPVTLAGSDADGNTLSFAIVDGPAHGTLEGTAPDLTYSPAVDFSGTDQFTFVVNDGTVNSAAATVSITVTPAPVNNSPVATSSSVTTEQGTPVPVTLAGSDADGNTLSFAIVNGPAHGTLEGIAPKLTYSPAADFSGTDQFTFVVNDGTVNSAVATVSITVTPANSLPLPWDVYQLGTGNLAGTASYSAGVYTLAGSGALGETQDAATFAWQTLSGDGRITAHIRNLSDTGSATRVGVMIRESLAANSRQAFIGVNGTGRCQWQYRTSTGGTAAEISSKGKPTPHTWLRLIRSGGTITASKSDDSITWTTLGTFTASLPANCYIGLSVSSGSDTTLSTSQFSDVSIIP